MDERDDFFDEIIDDDMEGGDSELAFEAGSSTSSEIELQEIRTIVMTKGGMLALLSLKTSASGAQIVRVDPRQPLPAAQSYDDTDAAAKWFRRSVATSRKNGWSVVYDGPPQFG